MPDFVTTQLLRIGYETGGPLDGPAVLLLHGWPDDPRTYDKVAPALQLAGFRTVVPYLRGFGPTTFVAKATTRSGEMVAMAQDVIDLADALGIKKFAVVGHDWGARIAYVLAAAFPDRIGRLCAMSVAWQPGELPTPGFEQARMYWYQWFFSTERGADVVRRDGKNLTRWLWQTWGAPGWFNEAEFAATAKSFENPDWAAITLHSYRVRWGEAEKDARYAALDRRAKEAQSIAAPALIIHGGVDGATLANASGGKDRLFPGGYDRHVLDGVGHFPTRERPEAVSRLVVNFLKTK